MAYYARSELHEFVGDAAAAIVDARRAVVGLSALRISVGVGMAQRRLGETYLLERDWDRAIEALERALSVTRESRTNLAVEARSVSYLAAAYLGRGDALRASELAAEARELARRRSARLFECHAGMTLARALARDGGAARVDDARAALEPALELAQRMSARPYEAQAHEQLAELADLVGDDAEAEHHLREAHRLYTEMGATGHAERVARELGKRQARADLTRS
jgi:tetratricopeptide (TPR) repeat protein